MKRLVLFFVLAACVVASSLEPVRAASGLETWCMAQGASWRADKNTCVVFSSDATVSETLALLSTEILQNHRTIANHGDIDNDGTIDNFGTMANHGDIHNAGDIYSYSNGIIANRGVIDNDGTIGNYGNIDNYGTISNDDTISNFGAIYNLCMSVFLGLPPSNSSGGVTYNLDNCNFMPMVARD